MDMDFNHEIFKLHLPLCGDTKGGFDCVVSFNPHPWEDQSPTSKGGSYVGDMGGFDTSL